MDANRNGDSEMLSRVVLSRVVTDINTDSRMCHFLTLPIKTNLHMIAVVEF